MQEKLEKKIDICPLKLKRSYGCFVKSQMEHGSFRCTVVLFLDQLQSFQLALFALLSKWILLKSVRN